MVEIWEKSLNLSRKPFLKGSVLKNKTSIQILQNKYFDFLRAKFNKESKFSRHLEIQDQAI
jgi:hypothetical protein